MSFYQDVVEGLKLEDVCTCANNQAKFALPGRDAGGSSAIPITNEILSKHILFLGGIGCGKTNTMNFLVRSLKNTMTKDDVMVIFDTKGDFYNEFYSSGDIVLSNDDKACGASGMDYWNIFREATVDSRTEENLLEISNMLFSGKIEGSSQPFFPTAAKDLFNALMLDMIRNPKMRGKCNNKNLRAMINSFSIPAMKTILERNADLKAMETYISKEDSGQTQGVVAELQQLVREIFVGNFAKPGNLSIRELIKNKGGKTIFIEYDLGFGATLTPIFRMLIDLAIKQALCRSEGERGNVYFVLDEFRLLPKLTYIDNGVNFGRSLGAKFIVGVQNVAQITDAYGENAGMSLLSGFSSQFCFRVNNGVSRGYIKQLYGKNQKKQTFVSAISSRGLSEQLREGNVVEDSDIAALSVGEAIVGILNYPHFKFRFNEYQSRMKKR